MQQSSLSRGGCLGNFIRFGAAAAVAATLGASAQAMECAGPNDRAGLSVRVLQTQLMVAALTCGDRDGYNRFVTRFQPHLAEHAGQLKRYFRQVHGSGYTRALNSYVTDVANRASSLSIADRAGFCAASQAALSQLLSAPDHRSDLVLSEVAAQTGGASDPQIGCDALTKRRPE